MLKKLSVFFIVLVLTVACSVTAFAAGEQTMSISFRIEGISANIYYGTLDVPYSGDSLTVKDALSYLVSKESSITVTGLDTNYITAVNSDVAGAFGGWDGWLYTVNGVEASVGIDSCTLKSGDKVVLYYGDPFGVGMQYPEADSSKISEGVLKFTSKDTAYDPVTYAPTVTVNPVADATVIWYYGNTSAKYTTDAAGEIKIDAAQLTAGEHKIEISKVAANGAPLVLRFANDVSVAVAAPAVPAAPAAPAENTVKSPKTFDSILFVIIISFVFCAFAASISAYKCRKNED